MTPRPGPPGEATARQPLIAIMQGRLSPPVDGKLQSFPAATWPNEFERAAAAGLDAIEWIFEARENPVLSDEGARRIRALTRGSQVLVRSICADYFMDATLHRGTDDERFDRVGVLHELIDKANEVGARHIVLPFVDQSAIETDSDRDRLLDVLRHVIDEANARQVELHLEASLHPNAFSALLDRMPPGIKANYDSGNSASLGYDVAEEFAAYGDRIGSIHIKDRVRRGGSVPLGTGNADFSALFDAVDRVGYRGLFTLQVARGVEGDEIEWARGNRAFVLGHLSQRSANR